MVVVEGCEVRKQPLHLLDLFEVGLILVVVVVNPFYKKKQTFNAPSRIQVTVFYRIINTYIHWTQNNIKFNKKLAF